MSFFFCSIGYLGDPLAIVSVRNNALSQQKKQQIAREFNYVTTAFLHDAPIPGEARRVDLFSPTEELRFSGYAILGTAHYIFQRLDHEDSLTSASGGGQTVKGPSQISRCALQTKAGMVQTHFDAARQVAAVEVPHDVHIHARETSKDEVLAVQRKLLTHPDIAKMKASYSIVSIAKGLTFTLVDFTNCPALLTLVGPGEAPEPNLDAAWATSTGDNAFSFCGAIYFLQLQTDFTEEPYITRLQVRMVAGGKEEAGSASGCCTLAAYLALQKGGKDSRHAYAIEQGVEMGRRSQLCVEVRLDEEGTEISRITLSARAAFAMEGRLL
ncbi:hypothetical protein AJ80_04438 [Polytolypa hystricis UAMH7299]|uniref:Uncharacterized protein n=1 Tax=Polytolypa hystricis (strain UAMH7299) TaxID=1447883 RepID=A0A2B7YBW2_POLH7|nr:hypothetical protein AJ80_04438 [Polytolypa hystricis UAMH7299]